MECWSDTGNRPHHSNTPALHHFILAWTKDCEAS